VLALALDVLALAFGRRPTPCGNAGARSPVTFALALDALALALHLLALAFGHRPTPGGSACTAGSPFALALGVLPLAVAASAVARGTRPTPSRGELWRRGADCPTLKTPATLAAVAHIPHAAMANRLLRFTIPLPLSG